MAATCLFPEHVARPRGMPAVRQSAQVTGLLLIPI